jgi:hypothetical protein
MEPEAGELKLEADWLLSGQISSSRGEYQRDFGFYIGFIDHFYRSYSEIQVITAWIHFP